MAVYVYDKEGNESLIPAERLQAHLEAGYTIEKCPSPEVEEIDLEDAPTFEEADTNGSGKLSAEEMRAAAQEAGIEGWDNKRIKTLKAELGYE